MLLELAPQLVVSQGQIRKVGRGLGARRQGGEAAREAAKTEFEREFLLAAAQKPEEPLYPGHLASCLAHDALRLHCREGSLFEL